MLVSFNMTTTPDDTDRFESREDLLDFMGGFDGLELMHFGDNDLITPDMVTGVHLNCHETWYDFFTGNEEVLLSEFDDLETVERVYGSLDPQALVDHFKRNVQVARRYGAQYVVFHVSEASVEESLTFCRRHTNEQVIDAACDLLNQVFADEDPDLALMLENLWYPGLTITDPAMTRRLFEGVRHPNKGIMFDTGHLLHTDFTLRSQEEGLAYINRRIDEHEQAGLLPLFRGMHLQQSITGEYCQGLVDNPIELAPTYSERLTQVFMNIFKIDQHQPFTCKGVREMIDRLPLDFLTFEFITESRQQHAAFLRAQRQALGIIGDTRII